MKAAFSSIKIDGVTYPAAGRLEIAGPQEEDGTPTAMDFSFECKPGEWDGFVAAVEALAPPPRTLWEMYCDGTVTVTNEDGSPASTADALRVIADVENWLASERPR